MLINEMKKINIKKKKILMRLDLNVPIKKNKITSYARINSSLPTIKFALKQNAKIIILSHLGRPQEGKYEKKYSLLPIVKYLKKKLQNTVIHFSNKIKNNIQIKYGEILVLENVRFNKGEKKNCKKLSKQYANLCDIFVMDAFGTSHRIEASTYGVGMFAKISCAGPLLISEIKSLKKAIKNPKKPVVTILGGSKISTKFNILKNLAKISDFVIVGGGIANTFLAINYYVGNSIFEKNFIHSAKILKEKYNIFIPIDCKVKNKKNECITKPSHKILNNEEIMDIGEKSIKKIQKIIKNAKTIIWNGPIGVFELQDFRLGTEKISHAIANNKEAFSIAGGGDTLAVIEMFNIKKKISYISTGGGAFLEFIEKKTLPAIQMLQLKYLQKKSI
ncbi:phosphoglycerate kinase [Buchnera aphidicola]|uniref:phosphoglycerate kinase n=1 Tax=Buchnera aphidicola TaxID=9 RepID=UPI002092D155|nr:phosphoglycerate kinase [Buchnera aphidicola]USS94029.1 phosphoglycerate kinase [Buchnera aphidicola (Sipha maydis)]WII23573.1 phosphoglycerate kinase [Buchnera aphidicola (Sipha maydis)]